MLANVTFEKSIPLEKKTCQEVNKKGRLTSKKKKKEKK
jgi:hypothetical protein